MALKEKVSVAVVGKSSHAGRLIAILQKMADVELRWVYYPRPASVLGLPMTDDFDRVRECDAVVIASPTFTHFEYLMKLTEGFNGYVLVEKPAVSTFEEDRALRALSEYWKKRVKVNFNLLHSPLVEALSSLLKSGRLGELSFFSVYASHGLAFKDSYKSSWRADSEKSLGVLELVGTHYINLAIQLFGRFQRHTILSGWQSQITNDADDKDEFPVVLNPDTVLVVMPVNGVGVSLYLSYAGPCFNRVILAGTDGYFEYDGSQYRIFYPRDVFDASGRFLSPPCVECVPLDHSTNWQSSLEASLRDFINVVGADGEFPCANFTSALDSMGPIFDLRRKLKGEKS